MKTCSDCGCKVYSGHCVNCHEETYIYQQNDENEERICFGANFIAKVKDQKEEARKLRNEN